MRSKPRACLFSRSIAAAGSSRSSRYPFASIKEALPRLLAVEIRFDARGLPDTGGGAGGALDQGRALSHLRAISLGLVDRILPVAALRHADRHHGRRRGYDIALGRAAAQGEEGGYRREDRVSTHRRH